MKIVQICTQMEGGGAQQVAAMLNRGLKERGHDAQLWFLYQKRPFFDEDTALRSLSLGRPSLLQLPALMATLCKNLQAFSPDAVITHTHSANAFAAPVAAAVGVPVRLAVHHNPQHTYSLPMRIADRLAYAAGCYSELVSVSGAVSDSFRNRSSAYRRRMHRIYNAVQDEGSAYPLDIRARFNIPKGLKVLVNVGRLARQKNQSLLLQALQCMPDTFLLIVGEGQLRRELALEAALLGVYQRVRFAGEVAPSCVQSILKQADAFVLSSLYESFCLAAVEAMSIGLPVIASDLPCLREVLGEKQIYFPPGNLNQLVHSVRSVLQNAELRELMCLAGRTQASRFSVSRMVGEYECLLQAALAHAKPHSSAAGDLRGIYPLRCIPRVHDQI